jgi:hypothetical protein
MRAALTRAQLIIFAQPKERFVGSTSTQLTRRDAREGRLAPNHDRGPTTGGEQCTDGTNAADARIDIRSTFGHYRGRGRDRIFAYRALADGIFAQRIFTDRRSHRLRLRPWEVGRNCCSHES